MKNNYLLIFALLFCGNVAIGQIKQVSTIVLVKDDFQEDTFKKEELTNAKKTFDVLSQKIDSTINVLKSDTTLGLIFVRKDAKNVNVIFSFTFSAAQKNKIRSYIPTMLLTDKKNNHKISLDSWVIVPQQKDKTMADVVKFVNKELQHKALENCFNDYFCQYTTPDFAKQQSNKLRYDTVVVMISSKLNAPINTLSKATTIIAKNALIRQHLKNEQDKSISQNIFLANHKSNVIPERKTTIWIDFKVVRNKYNLVIKLMDSKNKTIAVLDYPETVLEIDKKRVDAGDYTEVNYKINAAMADLCNNFFLKNKKK